MHLLISCVNCPNREKARNWFADLAKEHNLTIEEIEEKLRTDPKFYRTSVAKAHQVIDPTICRLNAPLTPPFGSPHYH